MFRVTYITRAQSSGFENRNIKDFETLTMATAYIQGEWYDNFCEYNNYPDDWDADDYSCPMPKREDFNLEKKFRLGTLFAPYSKYGALVPDELRLEIVTAKCQS
jgi:hypothetical protein